MSGETFRTTTAYEDFQKAKADAIKAFNEALKEADRKAQRDRDAAFLRYQTRSADALAAYDRELGTVALESLQEMAWLERQRRERLNE